MRDRAPQPLPHTLAAMCDATAEDAHERDWFLHLESVRQAHRDGQDAAAVWVAITDEDGNWAVCDFNEYLLTSAEAEPWLAHPDRAENCDWLRSIVLDRFCDWLMLAGYDRNEAAAIRRRVINCEALGEQWAPTWERLDDTERHHALCVSMGVADPWASA